MPKRPLVTKAILTTFHVILFWFATDTARGSGFLYLQKWPFHLAWRASGTATIKIKSRCDSITNIIIPSISFFIFLTTNQRNPSVLATATATERTTITSWRPHARCMDPVHKGPRHRVTHGVVVHQEKKRKEKWTSVVAGCSNSKNQFIHSGDLWPTNQPMYMGHWDATKRQIERN